MNLCTSIIRSFKLLTGIIFLLTTAGYYKQSSVPPILILTDQNGFGFYTGEILKAEGFNEFIIDSITGNKFSKSFLSEFDIVILPEQSLDASTKRLIS